MKAANFVDTRHSTESTARQFRTIFVSDLHLGAEASKAGDFIDFLRHHDADTIYLAGDIIDFWSVKRSAFWTQAHNDVLQKLLRKARKGTRIIYIPGNHDAGVRDYCGMVFGAIEIRREAFHVAANGMRLLVTHGDEFDAVARNARWSAFLGDRSYEFAQWSNRALNRVRRLFGFGYWSLFAYLKSRVPRAANFIAQFEHGMVELAKRRGAEGVVCGHIHHPACRMVNGMRYINCGDWLESCTAIAEDYDGQFHEIRWHGLRERSSASLFASSNIAAPHRDTIRTIEAGGV